MTTSILALPVLRPKDVCLGNFIDCFGKAEMVTGIVPREGGDWFICHKADYQKDNPIVDGIEFNGYPIPLTEDWKRCLGVEKYTFPAWVEYVHQAQNYMRWYANIELLETFDWELFKELKLSNINP